MDRIFDANWDTKTGYISAARPDTYAHTNSLNATIQRRQSKTICHLLKSALWCQRMRFLTLHHCILHCSKTDHPSHWKWSTWSDCARVNNALLLWTSQWFVHYSSSPLNPRPWHTAHSRTPAPLHLTHLRTRNCITCSSIVCSSFMSTLQSFAVAYAKVYSIKYRHSFVAQFQLDLISNICRQSTLVSPVRAEHVRVIAAAAAAQHAWDFAGCLSHRVCRFFQSIRLNNPLALYTYSAQHAWHLSTARPTETRRQPFGLVVPLNLVVLAVRHTKAPENCTNWRFVKQMCTIKGGWWQNTESCLY